MEVDYSSEVPIILNSSVFLFGTKVLLAGLMAAFAIVVWYIVRKRRKRIKLPIVKILDLEQKRLPRFSIKPPPFIPFLSFLLCALLLVFFTTRPKEKVFSESEPKQFKYHLYIDLSPSNQAYVSVQEIEEQVTDLVGQAKEGSIFTIGSSISDQITQVLDVASVAPYFEGLNFHSYGVKLANQLQAQLESIGEIDKLLIFSDGDEHTWQGFNWQFLEDKLDVYMVRGNVKRGLRNIFFNDVRNISAPSSPIMEWEVDLGRSNEESESSGRLIVKFSEKEVSNQEWIFPPGKRQIQLRIALNRSTLKGNSLSKPLTWELQPDGEQQDAILVDNVFRSAVYGQSGKVAIIGGTNGEGAMTDPAYSLASSLSVLGFTVKRVDHYQESKVNITEYPLAVLLSDPKLGRDAFCPDRIVKQSAEEKAMAPLNQKTTVWIVPNGSTNNYFDLCRCYHILSKPSAVETSSNFCKEVETLGDWNLLLSSLGANQFGGNTNDENSAIGWSFENERFKILAFTRSLRPTDLSSLSHASLPVVVKETLIFQNHIERVKNTVKRSWPRLEDRSLEKRDDKEFEVTLSNVPIGESLMKSFSEDSLPETFTFSGEVAQKVQNNKRDLKEPTAWLQIIALLMLVGLCIEVGFCVFKYLVKKSIPFLGCVCIVVAGFKGYIAEAKVQIAYISSSPGFSLRSLAGEVESRTSIEMEVTPLIFDQLAERSLVHPWLWVDGVNAISEKGGFSKKLIRWIDQGGFLVVQGKVGVNLPKLLPEGKGGTSRWNAIPPDHELMRSFYLLDSLPSCSGSVWQGYQYDGRLAILVVPYNFLGSVKDNKKKDGCSDQLEYEDRVRVFVNILMVALTTDYKKDQIHLPEILKRLR